MPVEQIDDPSVNIKPTRKLTEFIKKKVNGQNIPENVKSLKKSKNSDLPLKLNDIKWLNNYLIEYRKNSDTKIYLHELLKSADLNLPSPKITPRSPELEARIQRLTAEQHTREYQAMTKEIDPGRKRFPEDTIAYQMKEINKQLIAVAQFIFSVIAAFAFGFIGVELIVGNLDFGFRLLLGIICGLIVALAEIYFLAKKLSECYDEVTPPRPPLSSKLHQE